MAIKEYRVPQANLRPIYKKPVRLPRDYVQPSKAAAKETPEVPLAKGQAPIAAQGRSPRYDAGSLMGLVSSLRSPGEANPAFDSSKPIGGENVPYKGTSGIGGVFSRIFGNRANELNLEAQQTQAAEMRDKALRDEERKARKEDLAEEIRLREEGPMKRFETEQKRLTDKDIRDEIAREEALDLQLVREGEKDILGDVDMARREVRDAEERALREREFAAREARDKAQQTLEERRVKLAEDVANKARYRTVPTEKGGVTVIDEHTGKPLSTYHPSYLGMVRDPKTGKEMPGTIPGRWEEYGETPKAPAGKGAQVDRTTGATLGGPLPTATGASVTPPRSAMPSTIDNKTTTEAPEQTSEPRYSIWTGRYPGQPEPPLGTLNFETTRKFLGPLGESISGAADRFSKPIPKRDLTNPEMLYNPDAYKAFLRRQMSEY